MPARARSVSERSEEHTSELQSLREISYADDVPLQPWLFEQIFPLEAKLTPEAVYAFTKLSILCLLYTSRCV